MLNIQLLPDHAARLCTYEEMAEAGYTPDFQNRRDWKSLTEAEEVAARLNTYYKGDKVFIGTDAGACCSPRYDICEIPKVGDDVSYAFNGDSYPCGKIVSISSTLKKITTDDGKSFYRRKLTGTWVNNGTWSLVRGHTYTQNPHF